MAEYKKWFHLFWTTLLIGAGGAVIAGLALQFVNGKIDFKSVGDFFLYPLILLGYGMLVSVYSQLGFCLFDFELYGQRRFSSKGLEIHTTSAFCARIA